MNLAFISKSIFHTRTRAERGHDLSDPLLNPGLHFVSQGASSNRVQSVLFFLPSSLLADLRSRPPSGFDSKGRLPKLVSAAGFFHPGHTSSRNPQSLGGMCPKFASHAAPLHYARTTRDRNRRPLIAISWYELHSNPSRHIRHVQNTSSPTTENQSHNAQCEQHLCETVGTSRPSRIVKLYSTATNPTNQRRLSVIHCLTIPSVRLGRTL